MADKRMFNRKITDSDEFISMSASAQALYFHLNQGADDDGFNNQVQLAMMKAHASADDLMVLLSKSYIIRFESGVIVIKHWRMNNTLRKDRYTPTNYQEELHLLGIKKNGAYTLDDTLVANWLPDGCQMVAVDKYSIDKNIYCSSNDERESEIASKIESKNASLSQLESDFELIYKIYPKKVGKAKAFARYQKWVSKTGYKINGRYMHLTNKQIWKAVDKYVKEREASDTDMQYYKGFDVLMGDSLLDYVEED